MSVPAFFPEVKTGRVLWGRVPHGGLPDKHPWSQWTDEWRREGQSSPPALWGGMEVNRILVRHFQDPKCFRSSRRNPSSPVFSYSHNNMRWLAENEINVRATILGHNLLQQHPKLGQKGTSSGRAPPSRLATVWVLRLCSHFVLKWFYMGKKGGGVRRILDQTRLGNTC